MDNNYIRVIRPKYLGDEPQHHPLVGNYYMKPPEVKSNVQVLIT